MSGEFPRQPLSASTPTGRISQDSLALAAGFLGLIACIDVCLVNGFPKLHLVQGREIASLVCLLMQTVFLSLLVRNSIQSELLARTLWAGNFLLMNVVIAAYAAQKQSEYGYASAVLAGELAFLAIWLVLGTESLGWRVLVTFSCGGILLVGWYGYAARRSTADWNLVWLSETIGVVAAAGLLRIAGFKIRFHGHAERNSRPQAGTGIVDGEGQFRLWHLMAGMLTASCLLGFARMLGVLKPTYIADLTANEISAADIQRGACVGLAASLAVTFAAHSVLLRTNFATRYIPSLIYAAAMGYAIHTWGPPDVDGNMGRTIWFAKFPAWRLASLQWPVWMLLNAGMAMGGGMFLHALGYRLTRNQPAAREATNAR